MRKYTSYILIPLLSILLVSAQAFWGSFIKSDNPFHGSFMQTISRFVASPKVWIGGLLYASATIIYFLLLSKYKFFSVQVAMTALAILFSTILSLMLFHERLSGLNILGMVIILIGIVLVFTK